jgi:membrane-bound serine protease (ClpP class)
MKTWLGLFLVVLTLGSVPLSAETPQRVLWVPLQGTVELGLAPFIVRAIEQAESGSYSALVLDVDTFGGRVDAAVTIRDALLNTKIPTVAWVNKRAISAGALISLACQKIYFSPGSTMGAATPIQMSSDGKAQSVENKMVSYFRAEMGATAEKNGKSRTIAEAMVLATEDIKGLVQKGDVLTLTDITAAQFKMSDGTATSRDDVLKMMGMENAQVVEFEINWAERIVRFLTEPTVSGLLMSAGILGIILELQAPGFGLPGILGIACLALFFLAKWIVFLAGWEEIILMGLGITLIALELLVLPGKFIFGLLGVALTVGALLMAGISPRVPFDWSMPDVQAHMNGVALAFIIAFVGMIVGYILMARNPRRLPLVSSYTLDRSQGYSSFDDHQSLVGKLGLLKSDLRPSGKALIEGKVWDVVSDSEFLKNGAPIQVVSVEGGRIVVQEVKGA